MPSVDNRVVRMEFDNASFEAKIKQTLASLTQLDKALKMEGAKKGLTGISEAAGKVKLEPIHTAVDKVSTGFLAMSAIAITALSQITSRAISAGTQIVKALTIKPILDGFREYETNIGSIQTILANTKADNTGLDDVNKALNTLNEYSDKTIYNFGQMARNIGTFTAAGVDLQTSVDSIKGISNLAAISGSSAEQAATAMYQLSQAVSTGTLRLIDWNSVVNAGMGGEVFQKALFETGKAMGTITDVPIDTTFEQWTKSGNSFRDSLQDGWLTSKVLTTTLQGFTGEMTEAQLLAIGYTKEQAASIIELGKTGVEAATKIRTLSQLLNTVKETIGSGWSATFRTVIGDFEEASDLFTNINNSISDFVNKQADARNAMLKTWKDLGGRTLLINSIKTAFQALGDILGPIKDSFREIFPKTTGRQLFQLTQAFYRFAQALKPSESTIEHLREIASGFFSILDLGWETIKAGVGFIANLVKELTGLGDGNILALAGHFFEFFTNLRDGLDQGEAIHRFFDRLTESLQKPIAFINAIKEAIGNIFSGFSEGAADAASAGVDRLSQRFSGLKDIFNRIGDIWKPLQNALEKITDILGRIGSAIGNWFKELGQKLADNISAGEFNNVLDALNVTLLGGITALLAKWLKGGINFDIGKGLFGKLGDTLGELTGTLKAMQTQIKANALVKIATAVGILSASVIALSLVDSAALSRALAAMAVGFGQLMASFAIMTRMDIGLLSGATFTTIATGMIALSTALLIMSGAIAVLAHLSWSEILRGLTAMTVILGVMTATAIGLSKYSGNFILASIGIVAISVALTILAGALKLFSKMDWGEMAKGFVGIAGGLLIIAGAMQLMPANMALTGAGLILVAIGLNILALAVKSFAEMDWGEMGKGFVGIGGGLLIIAGAMHLMPPNMLLTAAALVIVGTALNIIAQAVQAFGSMDWGEIAKGLVAMGGALVILAIGANAMNGALPGAAAMLVMSVALTILANVLEKIADIPFGDLIKSIGGIALALVVLGVAAALLQPVIPAMLGLGVALLLVGAAFTLFGIGALATAKAFEILAKAGPAAADAIVAAMRAIGEGLPALIAGFAEGILDLIQVFIDAAPVIAEAAGIFIGHVLDTLVDAVPKLGILLNALIDVVIQIIHDRSQDAADAGVILVTALLNALDDNIEMFVKKASDIITKFLNGIAAELPRVVAAGINVVVKFLNGIAAGIPKIAAAVGRVMGSLLTAIASYQGRIITAGANAIISLVTGLGRNLSRVIAAGVTVIINFVKGLGSQAIRLADAAAKILIDFLNGLAAVIRRRSPELRQAGLNIASAIIDGMTAGIASKAGGVIRGFVDMAKGAIDKVKGILDITSPSKVFFDIGAQTVAGFALGLKDTSDVERSAEGMAKSATTAISDALVQVTEQLNALDDFNPVITPVLDLTQVQADAAKIASLVSDAQPLAPVGAINTAQAIAKSPQPGTESFGPDQPKGGGDIIFEQTINSPTELSASAIYKQTRNQITLAKEELKVP